MNIPAPKVFNSLPAASNSSTGGSWDAAHELTPHRSATQMCPVGATNTALLEPIVRPAGSVNHRSAVRYGFG
jgi:hypothetical protein